MGAETAKSESEYWTDALPIGGRAASNLRDEYEGVDELIAAYREAEDITEVPQVGSATMRDLKEFMHERDPEAERANKENDEAICTEFTTDHGLDDTDTKSSCFAFLCPRCGAKNALEGEPSEFKNKPFGCTGCGWVSLLEADALERFVEADA